MDVKQLKVTLYVLSGYFLLAFVNGFYKEHLLEEPFFWAADFLERVLFPIVLLAMVFKDNVFCYKTNLQENQSVSLLSLYTAISSFALILIYILTIKLCLSLGLWTDAAFAYDNVLKDYTAIKALYMSLTAALFEELFYRSMLYSIIRNYFVSNSEFIFVVVSSVLFASVHWEGGVQAVAGALSFGVGAAVLYLWFGHVFPIIVAHFALDLLLFDNPQLVFRLLGA